MGGGIWVEGGEQRGGIGGGGGGGDCTYIYKTYPTASISS